MANCPGSSGCLFRLLDGASVSVLGHGRAIWGVVLRPAGLTVGPSATKARSEDGGQTSVIPPDRFLLEPVKSTDALWKTVGSSSEMRTKNCPGRCSPTSGCVPKSWEQGLHRGWHTCAHGPVSHGSHEVEQPRCPSMYDGPGKRGPSSRVNPGTRCSVRTQWDAVDPTHVGGPETP